VSVSNFPATQPVSGTVTANPMPFGLFNMNVVATSAGTSSATQNFNIGSHAVEANVFVNLVQTGAPSAPALLQLTLTNVPGGPVKFPLVLGYQNTSDGAGTYYYSGLYGSPIAIPANTDITVSAALPAAYGTPSTLSATFSITGVNLN
jgi:hypothetical protein